MCEDGGPPSDEALRGGLPGRGWDGASARMGPEADGFFAPPATCFDSADDKEPPVSGQEFRAAALLASPNDNGWDLRANVQYGLPW